MDNTLHIVYILDTRYWYPTVVSARSALINQFADDKRPLAFDLIVSGLNEELRRLIVSELESSLSRVNFIEADMSLYDNLPAYKGTKMLWTRCWISDYLKDINDWVCVCDGDTLWLASPSELFKEAKGVPGDVVVLGSDMKLDQPEDELEHLQKYHYTIKRKEYFCMGFELFHLGRLRGINFTDQVNDFVKKFGMPLWVDQDIFNCLLYGRTQMLPLGWGASPVAGVQAIGIDNIKVLHYYGALPWPASYSRRMLDVHCLWWVFCKECIKVLPTESKYRMTFLKKMFMRASNWCFPLVRYVFPILVKGSYDIKHINVRCQLRRLLKVSAEFCKAAK